MKDKKQGFTLIELLLVLAISSVILGIGVYRFSGLSESLSLKADQATTEMLNRATGLYRTEGSLAEDELFSSETTDAARLLLLQDQGYLKSAPLAQAEGASFVWSSSRAKWLLYLDGVPIRMSGYGRNFTEISQSLIDLMVQRFNEQGDYGRDWGDYKYTDIGLDPDVWKDPAQHVVYVPSGDKLRLAAEEKYGIRVRTLGGETKVAQGGWGLVYHAPVGKWYFHSVLPQNEIDIESMEVFLRNP